jgi:ADP-ribose pyrophosphatase YjhB (NUDIX family)
MEKNSTRINFCTHCGAPMEKQVPPDDDHLRSVCTQCPHIHYENPKMVVGCIPTFKEKILLCKRNIEPQRGKWTLPAGYLENSESVQEGAARETLEETRADVLIIEPYRLFNLIVVDQVYLMFRARMKDENFGPTSESTEVRLFGEADIPWDEIAFEAIRQTLVDFFLDRKNGAYLFKIKDLTAGKLKKSR